MNFLFCPWRRVVYSLITRKLPINENVVIQKIMKRNEDLIDLLVWHAWTMKTIPTLGQIYDTYSFELGKIVPENWTNLKYIVDYQRLEHWRRKTGYFADSIWIFDKIFIVEMRKKELKVSGLNTH